MNDGLGYVPVYYWLTFASVMGLAALLRWFLFNWIERFDAEALLRIGWLRSQPLGTINGKEAHHVERPKKIDVRLIWRGVPFERDDFPLQWWMGQALRFISLLVPLGVIGWFALGTIGANPKLWPVMLFFVVPILGILGWQVMRCGLWLGKLSSADSRLEARWDKLNRL